LSAHENLEHAEHVEHASQSNKKIALQIAILALFLAFSETLGKSAQTAAIADNIKASDTWNFFQAKTIRQTSLRIAADGLTAQLPSMANDEAKAAIAKQIESWRSTVSRYESDPKEMDGRKELRAIAEKLEHERDTWLARYHQYEFASAAFQIGIVLASAQVITGIVALGWLSGLLGVFGLGFMALGLWAPHALHLAGH
jgi:transcriptional regulator with XRE-family HTH domain